MIKATIKLVRNDFQKTVEVETVQDLVGVVRPHILSRELDFGMKEHVDPENPKKGDIYVVVVGGFRQVGEVEILEVTK